MKAATGAKVRPIELSLLQRCAAHCASGTDIAEAFLSGKTAVEAAVAGQTDKMVGFKCTRGKDGYHCETELFDLSLVANTEKKVPLEWINEAGNGVTQDFIDYCLPLIQGETNMVKEDGLPPVLSISRKFLPSKSNTLCPCRWLAWQGHFCKDIYEKNHDFCRSLRQW